MENYKTTRESMPGESREVQSVNANEAGIENTESVEVSVQPKEPQPVQPETQPAQRAETEPSGTSPQSTDRFSDVEKQIEGPVFVIWGSLKYLDVFQATLDFAKKNTGIPRLNVVLHTLGGNPNITFKSVVTLRSSCKTMVVYVPRWAKSAGTLLCLAADEIVLSLGSELGPLDMQVTDPRSSTEQISALSGYMALEAVANFLHDELFKTAKQLVSQADASIANALKYSMQLIDAMANPLFEQINPLDLGTFSNSLKVNERYGNELLTRFGASEKESGEIIEKLVRKYPSHAFVIDLHEAKKIGLRARGPNADETKVIDNTYELLKEKIGTGSYYGLLRNLGVAK